MRNSLVLSRAHRILKPLANFHEIEDSSIDINEVIDKVNLQEGEVLIGVYENRESDYVIVSNMGIRIMNLDSIDFIDYRSIDKVEIPSGMEKMTLDRTHIHLGEGRIIKLYITGGNDKFRDVFEFVRFLDRVTVDIAKRTGG
jgi:hypothetical protein